MAPPALDTSSNQFTGWLRGTCEVTGSTKRFAFGSDYLMLGWGGLLKNFKELRYHRINFYFLPSPDQTSPTMQWSMSVTDDAEVDSNPNFANIIGNPGSIIRNTTQSGSVPFRRTEPTDYDWWPNDNKHTYCYWAFAVSDVSRTSFKGTLVWDYHISLRGHAYSSNIDLE
jgi:hypothetical protein